MQHEVAKFLADMVRISTAVVTVETKFLTINENFLQEVGVDFRGTGGAGNKGTVAPLDDLSNGLQTNASAGRDNSSTADPRPARCRASSTTTAVTATTAAAPRTSSPTGWVAS
ncbi:MAG: hypothetical protein H6837_13365 [Planctomycetes bacterium]|nr:hypothetical protein [Planctomycetota bacterium]